MLSSSFGHIQGLREQNSLADTIPFPDIPKILTESLALYLLEQGLALERLDRRRWQFRLGQAASVIEAYADGEHKIIRVKGSGERAIQDFEQADLSADNVLWIHYRRIFQDPEDLVSVACIAKPRTFLAEPTTVMLPSLKKKVPEAVEETELDLWGLLADGRPSRHFAPAPRAA